VRRSRVAPIGSLYIDRYAFVLSSRIIHEKDSNKKHTAVMYILIYFALECKKEKIQKLIARINEILQVECHRRK